MSRFARHAASASQAPLPGGELQIRPAMVRCEGARLWSFGTLGSIGSSGRDGDRDSVGLWAVEVEAECPYRGVLGREGTAKHFVSVPGAGRGLRVRETDNEAGQRCFGGGWLRCKTWEGEGVRRLNDLGGKVQCRSPSFEPGSGFYPLAPC
jgi:hypothetical protein